MTSSNAINDNMKDIDIRRDARFFQPHLLQDRIPTAFADLLQNYSGIPKDEQVAHILTVRNQAYDSHPYPCLGRFRFLDLDLATHPLYESYILPQLKAKSSTTAEDSTQPPFETTFLDLGTCLSQDIRKLIYDGAPVERLYGADLDTTFVDIGYQLFRDENKLPRSHLLTGPGCNVLADPEPDPVKSLNDQSPGLRQLDGRIDILNATAIFHLFDYEGQKQIARRCLRLLRKPSTTNPISSSNHSTSDSSTTVTTHTKPRKSLILGGQAGNVTEGERTRRNGEKRFRHNEDSWREMWESVVAEPEWHAKNTRVQVSSQLVDRAFFTTTAAGTDRGEGDGKFDWNSMIVGEEAAGHRWHTYSIWVEFAS